MEAARRSSKRTTQACKIAGVMLVCTNSDARTERSSCGLSNKFSTTLSTMKFAFAIATIAALQQAAVTRADCDFGSNYTSYFNSSDFCSFDVGFGYIGNFSESNTISSGDTNVTTRIFRGKMAVWKIGEKDSTVQCYSDNSENIVSTTYPNGSTFQVETEDSPFGLYSQNTVADGVPLSTPGLYYFQGGHVEFWIEDGNKTITKAEGDITDLCEVLGGGGGDAAPAPTPTPPTTEAPSSGQMAAVTIIPCVSAAILNYFFSFS